MSQNKRLKKLTQIRYYRVLTFYSNNVLYIFLILKKKKNEVLDDKTLLLLIITKLIKSVLPIKKTENFSNFLLITSF